MKKRIWTLLLAACLLLNLAVPAFAQEAAVTADESGSCGENLTWTLEGNTLTISGAGEMDDGSPWDAHRKKIETVVLTGGVTSVGEKAFFGYDRLESVDFGSSLVEIGAKAFADCTDLTVIHLPATFRTFGAECFRGCSYLKKVYCDGGMPRFNESCLWTGEYISVFYPTNNPWPADAVNQLVHNFGGRMGVMMGNYTGEEADEPEQTEAEAEETEAAETIPAETEAPAPAPTEASAAAPETEPIAVIATEAPTEAPTEPETTEAQTEAPTELPTEAPTQAPTEPAEPDPMEDLGSKSWIGLVMIAGVLSFLILGAIIFRVASRKGGRYSR